MQVVIVENISKGIERAKEEIYKHVDKKTVLFLSGGKTPKPLYETLVKENILKLAAAALIDERYGKVMHKNSNEKMITETGILDYFTTKKIPFYGILQQEIKKREETAKAYDETVRKLFFQFPKSVGILGIGTDGHTAGIAPNRENFTNPLFDISQKHLFASSFDDKGIFGERITLTFSGLSLLDFIIVLAFGKDKQDALQKALTHGSVEEIPARFYQNQEIAKKTLFITDQKI